MEMKLIWLIKILASINKSYIIICEVKGIEGKNNNFLFEIRGPFG